MNESDFPTLVVELLVTEYGRTREDAERMCRAHARLMADGVAGGLGFPNVRATAFALVKADDAAGRAG